MDWKKVKILEVDKEIGQEVLSYIDTLTKPPGSLGRLEGLAAQLAQMQGERFPKVTPPGVLVFAGDHGITDEGVSAFPKEVTVQMVTNFLNGGAAINVFSKQIGALLEIIDIGVEKETQLEGLICEKVKNGTNNFVREDAMTRAEAEQAIEIGYKRANTLFQQGVRCLIVGEMGIGNTTSSSAVLSALTGVEVSEIVGRGTGIAPDHVTHKISIIKKGLDERQPNSNDPIDVLAKVGGLEIAGMTGAMIAAAEKRIPILVDGFICTVAAILAERLKAGCRNYMIIGHNSVEPGHKIACELLEKEPIIDLQMRLGEGSGAAVAFPILQSATLMLNEMATFTSAGISNKE